MNPYLYERPSPLLDDDPDGHWSERALCAQTDPDLFYPDKGGSTRAPKKVCLACEVRAECLADALALDPMEDRHGIRGGLSETERRVLRGHAGRAA